jgi:hypothetical protein
VRGEDRSWIEKKVGFMRLGWADEDEAEVSVFYEFGRGCEGFWVEQQWRELVERGSRVWREKRDEEKGLHVFHNEGRSTTASPSKMRDDGTAGASPTESVRSTFEKIKRGSKVLEFRMPMYGRA